MDPSPMYRNGWQSAGLAGGNRCDHRLYGPCIINSVPFRRGNNKVTLGSGRSSKFCNPSGSFDLENSLVVPIFVAPQML